MEISTFFRKKITVHQLESEVEEELKKEYLSSKQFMSHEKQPSFQNIQASSQQQKIQASSQSSNVQSYPQSSIIVNNPQNQNKQLQANLKNYRQKHQVLLHQIILDKRRNEIKNILIPLRIQQNCPDISKKSSRQYSIYFSQGKKFVINDKMFYLDDKQILFPQILMLKLLRDLANGICQLQELRIYNNDINLKNIIYFDEKSLFGEQRFMIIDLGDTLTFNEQFDNARSVSKQIVAVINKLKARGQDCNDYLNFNKSQISFQDYEKKSKERHFEQFKSIYNDIQNNFPIKSSTYFTQIIDWIEQAKQGIINYKDFTEKCNRKIDEFQNIKTNGFELQSFHITFKKTSQENDNNQQSKLDKQKSEDRKDLYQQTRKFAQNSEHIQQSSQIIDGIPKNNISEDSMVQNFRTQQNKDYHQQINSKAQQKVNKNQLVQQSCDHKTMSKICLSKQCILKNKCLLCGCQRDHINQTSPEFRQCNIVSFEAIRKLIQNQEEKIRQWGSQKQYLRLVQYFTSNPLKKIQPYYKQIMGKTIQNISSLWKINQIINNQQMNSANIPQIAFNLNGMDNFLKLKGKIEFDQFIQFTSDTFEHSFSKIIEFAQQKLESLKNKIEALSFNESNNIVRKYLNQKYRTVVNHPSYEHQLYNVQKHEERNKFCLMPFLEIKQHNLARVEHLTLGSLAQYIFEKQSFKSLQKKKLQQLQSKKYSQNNELGNDQRQKDNNTQINIYNDYNIQRNLCKTLQIIKNHLPNLKSLQINVTDSKQNLFYEFSLFDLFYVLSKTSVNNLAVKGIKLLQLQEFIKIVYEFKLKQFSQGSNNQICKEYYGCRIDNFHRVKLQTIQIDIQIRFIFKFKDSMKRKKQQLFYFLDYIKQLKSLTITFQFNYQQDYLSFLQLLEQLIKHPNIKFCKIKLHRSQIYSQDQDFNPQILKNISCYRDKIVSLQFQNIQFVISKDKSTKYFGYLISMLLSNQIKSYSVVNCKGFPMIDLRKTNLSKLIIYNTTFQTQSIEQQKEWICKEITSLCIRNSTELLQKYLNRISLQYLRELDITISNNSFEYLVEQQLPFLKLCTISSQKYDPTLDQAKYFLKFLKTTQQLQSLNVENIPVYSNSIECLDPENLQVLKLSHLIIKDKDDLIKIVDLFKKFKRITQLSLLNIIIIKDQLKSGLFYRLFDEMENLRKLIIDNSIINQQFDINELRNNGVFVLINKKHQQIFHQS